MGVPTFYRWLCNRYPRVPKDVVDNYKDHVLDLSDGDAIGLELLLPNPNGEFDNLYLDMNGIIHPCCHPENMEQPESEEIMFKCILDYIDRIFFLVRPRKLIYLAIDGVAPRAKINQQRTRRFKSAAQSDLEDETYEKLVREYLENNKNAEIPVRPKKWDSNVITPGTEFMYKLSNRIVEYIKDRVERYDAWRRIVVIFSDSNVPGEGEHKIMKFIRNQRHCPEYDPNTTHVLHGMDADLIMLGLATHEPKFYIIREIITHFINHTNTQKTTSTDTGHTNTNSTNNSNDLHSLNNNNTTSSRENKDNSHLVVTKTGNLGKVEKYMRMMRENWRPLQLLQLSVLREYLSYQLKFVGGFDDGSYIDFERCVDDLVLMIFFCGNDFLPNLPSISITGGSIDQMILLYQKLLPSLNDYLSNEGCLNFKVVDKFFKYLSKIEDETFRNAHEHRMRFQNQSQNQQNNQNQNSNTTNTTSNNGNNNKNNNEDSNSTTSSINNSNTTTSNKESKDNNNTTKDGNDNNTSSSNENKDMEPKTFKELFKETMDKLNAADDIKPMVDVTLNDSKLWKKAYYYEKFGLNDEDDLAKFVDKVSFDYITGICWVLQYYYQGCASWSWYYPHHYSPFCSDLDFSCVYSGDSSHEKENMGSVYSEKLEKDNNNNSKEDNSTTDNTSSREEDNYEKRSKRQLEEVKMVKFDLAKPLTPFQQLMGVMPIRSSHCIPKQLRVLMTDPESPIRHFYPVKFKEDPNGKRYKYQWVALLPFIDEEKLLLHVKPIEEQLSDDEKFRNRTSLNMIFINKVNKTTFLNKINQVVDRSRVKGVEKYTNTTDTNNKNNNEDSNSTTSSTNKTSTTTSTKNNNSKDCEDLFGNEEDEDNNSKENKESKKNKNKAGKGNEVEFEYFISECNKKHRSMLMKGVQLPPKILTVQDVMEEQRNRGFNCEVAKRMILNMLSSNKELHYNEHNETVLKDTARDYHQYHNQYNPYQYTHSNYQNTHPHSHQQTHSEGYGNNYNTPYQPYYQNPNQYSTSQQYQNQNYSQNQYQHYPNQNYQHNQYNRNQYTGQQQYHNRHPNQYSITQQYRTEHRNPNYQQHRNYGDQHSYSNQGQYDRTQQYHNQNQYNRNNNYGSSEQFGHSSKKPFQNNRNPNHSPLKRSSNEKYF